MPSNKKTPADRKFSVFISSQDDVYKYVLCERLIPTNFRKQMRGLGAASFKILRNEEMNTRYEKETVGLLEGRKIWICDADKMTDPKKLTTVGDFILWHGVVRSVTMDILEGVTDYVGTLAADEIGFDVASKSILRTRIIPPFNPWDEKQNCWWANKEDGTTEFKFFPTLSLNAGTENPQWSTIAQDSVWSRKEVIEYLCALCGYPTVTFPDDKSEFFFQKKNPMSFNSYQNENIHTILMDLLESPFDFYYDYISSFQVGIKIVNKSTVALPGICIANTSEDVNIDPETVTLLNIQKESSEVYDQITMRGNRILWAGSCVAWDPIDSLKTLKKDWTDIAEQIYVHGKITNDHKAPGTYESEELLYNDIRNRPQVAKVYSYLKFVASPTVENCWITTNDFKGDINVGHVNTKLQAFFGSVYPFDSNNGVPFVAENPYISVDVNSHKTPPKFTESFVDILPWRDVFVEDDPAVSYYAPHHADRFVLAKCLNASKKYAFVNLTKSQGSFAKASFDFYRDGVIIKQSPPEIAAKEAKEFWQIGGPYEKNRPYPPENCDWKLATSNRNPEVYIYNGFTHWGTYECVFAGYSSQYLEVSVSRTKPDGTTASNDRTKIIEDPNYELWIVHDKTPKGTKDLDTLPPYNWLNQVDRWAGTDGAPIILRNDSYALLDAANAYANWLFQERRSLKLEFQLMNYDLSYSIGQSIKNVKDKTVTWQVNSSVESIEWEMTDELSPRVYISTNIPVMPTIKKAQTVKISAALPQPTPLSGDPRSPVQQMTKFAPQSTKNSNNQEQPIPIGGSGGGNGSPVVMAKVQGGNGSDGIYQWANQLPVINSSGNIVATPVVTGAWEEYTLPEGWKFGDPLKKLPDGLCWVQLQRPYSFSSAYWGSYLNGGLETIVTEVPELTLARYKNQTIEVFANQPFTASQNLALSNFGLTVTPSMSANGDLKITGFSLTNRNSINLQLNTTVDTDHIMTLEISDNSILSKSNPPVGNASTTLTVSFYGDKNTLALAINGTSNQNYFIGDLVTCLDETKTITDKNGVAKPVLSIISSSSQNRSHSHLDYAGDGQGYGRLTPIANIGGVR